MYICSGYERLEFVVKMLSYYLIMKLINKNIVL